MRTHEDLRLFPNVVNELRNTRVEDLVPKGYDPATDLFGVFERHRVSVDVVATSEVSVSVTVDDASRLEELVGELRTMGDVAIERREGSASRRHSRSPREPTNASAPGWPKPASTSAALSRTFHGPVASDGTNTAGPP